MANNYTDKTQYEQAEQTVQDDLEINSEFARQFPESFLTNWFAPGARQKIEAQQSLDMWRLQNAYDSPEEQMKRAAAAGINLNTAAGAAVGNNTSSNPLQPSSSAMDAGLKPSDVANAALGAVGAVQNKRALDLQEKLNDSQVKLNAALTTKAFEDAGYTKEMAKGAASDNKYKDAHNLSDLWLKKLNGKKMDEEWKYIKKQTEELQIRINNLDELIKSEIDLNKKNASLAEREELVKQQEELKMKMENEFFTKYGFSTDSPIDVALRNTWLECSQTGDYKPYYDMLSFTSDYFYNLHYNQQLGINEADLETAFDEVFQEESAKQQVNADYAPYLAQVEASKEAIIAYLQELYSNPSDMRGVVAKLINLISNLPAASQLDGNGVNGATTPPSKGRPAPHHQNRERH